MNDKNELNDENKIILEDENKTETKNEKIMENNEIENLVSIAIIVRVRPLNKREIELGGEECITITNSNQITLTKLNKENKKINKSFTFDKVFGKDSTQEEVYKETSKKLLNRITNGFPGCIFAYGQTGSGKSKYLKKIIKIIY
jgi:hypothetical protein